MSMFVCLIPLARALASLRELDMSFNKIREIPSTLGRVGTLKDLNLSNNYITVIPEELGLAQILEKLDLRLVSVKDSETH